METAASLSGDTTGIVVQNNGPDVGAPQIQHIPIPVTKAKRSPLTTLHVQRIHDLPAYPETHVNGLAYMVAARGRSREELIDLLNDLLSFQAHFFPDRLCVYRSATYMQADLCASYTASRFNRGAFQLRLAHIYWDALGNHQPYIACVNEGFKQPPKHHRQFIPSLTGVDVDFLEDLFNKDILPPAEECGTFESLSSRRAYCSCDHPQGRARMKHTKFDVTFNAFVPVDLSQCPYILFISHGVHKHPPPLPTKAPERIFLRGVDVAPTMPQIQSPAITTENRSPKRSRPSSSASDDTEIPLPQTTQVVVRPQSQSSQHNDTRSVQSIWSTPRAASTPALDFEKREQELNTKQEEIYLKQQELAIRKQKLELEQKELDIEQIELEAERLRLGNDRLELDLMQRRMSLQRGELEG
ncbi:hypothetical protein BDV18DRAFT_162592 [Aspergillus unguis]